MIKLARAFSKRIMSLRMVSLRNLVIIIFIVIFFVGVSVFNNSFKHKLFGLEDSLMAVEIWLVVVAFKPFNRLMAQPAFLDVTTKVPVDHAGLNRCLFTPFRSESESGSLFHVWFDDSKLEMLRINAITIVERS